MKNTAIIYSFNSAKSKKISEKVTEIYGKQEITAVNAEELNKNIIEKYDNFIWRVPTWFDGELPNYWDEFVPDPEEMDLNGKKFAIFGLGDQKGYPENFCDAIGILAEIIENYGGTIVGQTQIKNYNFESSRAQRGNKFIGLPLDQGNQARMTSGRIKEWVAQIKREF